MANSKEVALHRKRKKLKMVRSMGGCCQCCGYSKYIGALEFHHLDPSIKEHLFGSGDTPSWERLVVELRKCILVCSTCHKEIHAGVTQIPQNYARFDERYADVKASRALLKDDWR